MTPAQIRRYAGRWKPWRFMRCCISGIRKAGNQTKHDVVAGCGASALSGLGNERFVGL